jgi:hypothetical protein
MAIVRKSQRARFHRDFTSGPAVRQQTVSKASSGWISIGLLLGAVILHVAFPKAGFKWHDIPFTAPDIVYGVLLIAALFRAWRPFQAPRQLKYCALLMTLGIAFFGFRILYERFYGYRRPAADDLANLTALCVYPLILFTMVIIADRESVRQKLHRVLPICVAVVLLYGLAQKVFGDYAVVVPGLTANMDDASHPDFLAQKDNMLWDQQTLKLTSTYQNGNIFSVNLLILMPLAMALFRSKAAKLVIGGLGVVELGLAASRSAWVGAVCMALLALQLYVKRWAYRMTLLGLLAVAVVSFVAFVPTVHRRFLDTQGRWQDMGGRAEPAAVLWKESLKNPENDVQTFLFGPHGITSERIVLSGGGAYEMFYLALYQLAGWVGVLIWLAPLIFSLRIFYRHRADRYIRAVFVGVVAWLLTAVSEGAFWVPPTAFNLWMVLGLGWLRLQSIESASKKITHATKLGFERPAPAVCAGHPIGP